MDIACLYTSIDDACKKRKRVSLTEAIVRFEWRAKSAVDLNVLDGIGVQVEHKLRKVRVDASIAKEFRSKCMIKRVEKFESVQNTNTELITLGRCTLNFGLGVPGYFKAFALWEPTTASLGDPRKNPLRVVVKPSSRLDAVNRRVNREDTMSKWIRRTWVRGGVQLVLLSDGRARDVVER